MPCVLLVDPDAAVRLVVRSAFEQAGFAVLEAESAFQALDLMRVEPPDAIVSAVALPGMNGLAFYRQVVHRMPALGARMVFLTAASQDPALHRAVEPLGVPIVGKQDDLRLAVDAVRLALLRPDIPS